MYCVAFFLLGILGAVLEVISMFRSFLAHDLAFSMAYRFDAAVVMMHAANLGLAAVGIGVGIQIYLKHIVIRK